MLDLGTGGGSHVPGLRTTALSGVFMLILALLSLASGAWQVGATLGLFALSTMVLAYAGVGRIEFTERGLRYAPRFWPWDRFERHLWSDDGRWVALRQKAATFRIPWILIPVPEGVRHLVDGDLKRLVTGPADDSSTYAPAPGPEGRSLD